MSSDGPKNSQGYVRNPADAGMTNRLFVQQLLNYTKGEFTPEAGKWWLREVSQKELVATFLDLFRDPQCKPPALLRLLTGRVIWLERAPVDEWSKSDEWIANAYRQAFNQRRAELGLPLIQ